MKAKKIMSLVLGTVLALSISMVSFAGAPDNHGVDGREFGGMVSELAKSGPGAVAEHVSENSGGAPAKHGLSGMEFGEAVSGLAQTYPGAVADHVSGK